MPDPAHAPRPASGTAAELRRVEQVIPVWGPQLVILVTIIIDITLPDRLIPFGPRWLLPGLEVLLLVGLAMSSPRARHHSPARRRVALSLIGIVSLTNIISLIELVHFLVQTNHGHASISGHPLIVAGSQLWINNVLLFGLWYWELDRGGPAARLSGSDDHPDFLFVQMDKPQFAPPGWMPGLVDYLFLSFTNATAFSPTDTMPLTPMAKWLMSGQALVSLVTVGLVVARAVNILT
jgi:uncharacterized membrane protein